MQLCAFRLCRNHVLHLNTCMCLRARPQHRPLARLTACELPRLLPAPLQDVQQRIVQRDVLPQLHAVRDPAA
eukprot:3201174-Lingulodinium_polyedra.AAC.1